MTINTRKKKKAASVFVKKEEEKDSKDDSQQSESIKRALMIKGVSGEVGRGPTGFSILDMTSMIGLEPLDISWHLSFVINSLNLGSVNVF